MNFLLEITKGDYTSSIITTKGLTETLLFGLQMLAIGMLTVFSVLAIIWLALVIFKFFFHDLAKRERSGVIAENSSEVVESAPTTANNDEELVAVIAAAIAMAESESGNGIKYRVVSFKRR